MSKWPEECKKILSKKAGKASEEIVKSIREEYGVGISMRGLGPNADLQKLAYLNETYTLKELTEILNDIKELIKMEFKDATITDEQIDKVIYPIIKDFLDFVFEQAEKCNKKIPEVYITFYEEVSRYPRS